MITELIKKRNLPPLADKEEMLDVLLREEYGYLPKHTAVSFSQQKVPSACKNLFGGKALRQNVLVSASFGDAEFSFPIEITVPNKEGKHPFFVYISFVTALSSVYCPLEEIIDNGFGVAKVNYTDVTSDDADFTNGLAGVLFKNGKRTETDPGKISMWAWAASRALDYLETTDFADIDKVTVCGHSRLGKTALVAAATDTRFFCAHSNNSGCSGAALARDNQGETVGVITKNFPYWFCENYYKYAENEKEMPFDQHFLIASIAPRKVYVSSASEDLWADPENEFLSCVAASPAFEKGFVHENAVPSPFTKLHSGDVGYHIRYGRHFHSRQDWQCCMEFVKSKFI
ncbi:MAG: hypothetical protein IJ408_03485 [Clostridia bacterium]|nr:hypothetical protein [Clostridia bacterium]